MIRRGETAIKLQLLISSVDIQATRGDLSADIKGVTCDSRKVKTGDIFTALRGYKQDGMRFIDEARMRGAAAVLSWKDIEGLPGSFPCVIVKDVRKALAVISKNFFERPDEKIQVIGVTGTNGKTTTCYFYESIVSCSGKKIGVLGTVNQRIGTEKVASERTTPESPDIMAFLKKLSLQGAGYCVMEVSSHSIALDRVHGIRFGQMIFTNLTQDHLDFHKTMDDYFRVKAKVFEELPDDGQAIINIDSDWGLRLTGLSAGKISTYGLSDEADFRIKVSEMTISGSTFTVNYQDNEYRLVSPLMGIPNIYNAAAAFTASILAGFDPAVAIEGIGKMRHVPGRFERVDEGQDYTVIVDYAHTDDALENLLISLREVNPARIITVFGCGGDRDRTKRPKMGAVAARLSDYVIVTSDNPRSEAPERIISEIVPGIIGVNGSSSKYTTIADRADAIAEAIEIAHAGDIVVIAGKGHEKYQQIKDVFLPFDDRTIAATYIRKKIGIRTQNATA